MKKKKVLRYLPASKEDISRIRYLEALIVRASYLYYYEEDTYNPISDQMFDVFFRELELLLIQYPYYKSASNTQYTDKGAGKFKEWIKLHPGTIFKEIPIIHSETSKTLLGMSLNTENAPPKAQ